MQAIVTKYLSPTDRHGTRIKAMTAAGVVTMGYQYAMNVEDNHRVAAEMLANKFDWLKGWKLEGGQLRNGDYVWVMVPDCFRCKKGCGREEMECSLNPCDDVIADREATV